MFSYAHMCRDGHTEIGHNDNSSELCPLCRANNKVDNLRSALLDQEYHRNRNAELERENAGLRAVNAALERVQERKVLPVGPLLERDALEQRIVELERNVSEQTLTVSNEHGEIKIDALTALTLKDHECKRLEDQVTSLRTAMDQLKISVFAVARRHVMGLPCFCNTPELHDKKCLMVRTAVNHATYQAKIAYASGRENPTNDEGTTR